MSFFRRHFFILFIWIIFLGCGQSGEEQTQTNVILIMADDLGFETIGCYGGESYSTPHLDRLAMEGMKFTHCFANPLCTPSRVQIMTGKYNFRNYIGFGLLDPGAETFGDVFKQAGYQTCIVGKWQLFGNEHQRALAGGRSGSRPEEAGFDRYCLWQVEHRQSRYKDPVIETSEDGESLYQGAYGPDVFTDYLIEFIREVKDDPFFVYYPMCLTHDPFQPTPADPEFESFDVSKPLNDTTYFENMLVYTDGIVGRIVEFLQQEGLAKETLVIFTGDNGTDRDVISTWNGQRIRGNKGYTNRYGTNVPLIIHGSSIIEQGTTNDALIDFTDFLPTILEAADIPLPKDFYTDGVSFYPLLTGEDGNEREWVFCHYDPNWGKFPSRRWVQDHQWKYYEDGAFYDLVNDPHEQLPINQTDMSTEMKRAMEKFKTVLQDMQPGS